MKTDAIPSRKRRRPALKLVFSLLLAVFLWLLVEAGAYVAFWAIDGKPFTFARLSAEEATAGGRPPVQAIADLLTRPRNPGQANEFIHPYLGFLPLFDKPIDVKDVDVKWIFEPSTFDLESPLFRPREDTVVVAVIGGSVAFIFLKEGAWLLEQRLKATPGFRDKKLVFVGICAGGFKQPQQLVGVEYLLALGAHLDLVINIDGFNEVALHEGENMKRGVFPIYPRGWFSRLPGPPEFLPRMGEVAYLRLLRIKVANDATRSRLRWSVARHLWWRLRDRRMQDALARKEQEFRDLKPSVEDVRLTGPPAKFQDLDALYDHLVGIWSNCSWQLQLLCMANGMRYWHFLQPNQYFADSKPLSPEELETAYREDHNYRKGVLGGYARLVEAGRKLRERGVRFTDLTMIFKEVKETLYIDECCHFNARGNEIMAEAIAAAILGGQ